MEAVGVLVGLVVVALLVWIAVERRRWRRLGRDDPWRRAGGAVLGGLDEVFHPSAHHAAEVREVEERLPAPPPAPGDPPR